MISFSIDNNEVIFDGKGNTVLVCVEELLAINYLRDKLAEQLNMTRENVNEMIIATLHETE